MQTAAEEVGALPPEQHGFYSRHCTLHQLARVVTFIAKDINRGEITVAVFLDIKRAFDKLWHERPLVKLIRQDFPKDLVKLVGSYLEDRAFRVCVGQEQTASVPIQSRGRPGKPAEPPTEHALHRRLPHAGQDSHRNVRRRHSDPDQCKKTEQ